MSEITEQLMRNRFGATASSMPLLPCIPLIGLVLQSYLPRRDNRHFRHGKHAISNDQYQNDQNLESDGGHFRIAAT